MRRVFTKEQGRLCNWMAWKDLSPEKGQIVESLLVVERSWALTSGERNVHPREETFRTKERTF